MKDTKVGSQPRFLNKLSGFNTIEDLKSFETIDKGVSKKYVPIYSSEIIEHLSPEFRFTSGTKYYVRQSAHSIYFEYNGHKLSMENSYDRSRAFGFRLKSNNFNVPLNINRQIHLGENATKISANIAVNKEEIKTAIDNALTLVEKLKTAPATETFKSDILAILFAEITNKKDSVIEDFTGTLTDIDGNVEVNIGKSQKTIYSFVNRAVDVFNKGDYKYKETKRGVKSWKVGRKVKSNFAKLKMTNKIYAYLEKEAPELFI